ncbi:Serine/threonine-protein phosphatase 4 catalytic subunit [Tritrichomonas foetus]|uniref:Serine/threonine-protein phosphatase n=1 Tax=Tritrichomonas foetus TaxID=1144522 RepID=A0A1J4JHW5_9EUKA|nr:Serine/threonine-protein phosphatase 4 catalytic subunit [Tritrichomonas foetus]|eukprot:OHS97093.1 Serine/threonine-protein phosphatase 4 catalytic subunit [Tritrichomonas foetus]
MSDFNPDFIFEQIEQGNHLPEDVYVQILEKLREILMSESNCLELFSPITIAGDVHGQLFDVLSLFDKSGNPDKDPEISYLFLGDYVDRGYYSLETFAYLATLKIKHPHRIFLLRGNHELRQVNNNYGFYSNCVQTYGHSGIWEMANSVFDYLPICAYIRDCDTFCVHGGLSPKLSFIDELVPLKRNYEIESNDNIVSDILWSDPEEKVHCWKASPRGAGFLFGEEQVDKFMQLNRIKLIARSHQLAMDGFQYFFYQKLVTVWSAPNYEYRMGNKSTVMKIDSESFPDNIFVEFPVHPSTKTIVPDVSPYFL